MSFRKSLRLPKEHGAWAMLYVPFAAGWLVGGGFSLRIILLFLAVSFFFIARESLINWWRARRQNRPSDGAGRAALIYLSLAALAGSPLIIVYRLYWLAAFAAVGALLLAINAEQAARRQDRTIAGEFMAIGGLTLTSAAACYVASGRWENAALWLWALCALYFASSIFYVKLRVYTLNPRKEESRRRMWFASAWYHLSLLAGLAAFAATGSLSLLALIAFAPALGRTFWFLARPAREINLKRIGFIEIAYSLVFLIFITLTFRSN
ncbi:MAG TPA: YwiC-like family protein [Blastocatellia bacterium]|nr:YwiC-like family protein [Blastocatellia bacterium]